jgi:hypothetical protein
VDSSNKEYDNNGKLAGWWVVVPATDCAGFQANETFEQHTVVKYSLVRISRICAAGEPGCGKTSARADQPAVACVPGGEGLYIDRISCVGCDNASKRQFFGLRPVLVN